MTDEPDLSRGVENPRVIDGVHLDPESGEVVLTVLEARPWGEDPKQLHQLQEKLNSYLTYALDGHLVADRPDYGGKPLRIDLDCAAPPGAGERGFLTAFRNYSDTENVRFRVRPRPTDDVRLERGMQEQLRRRREAIAAGATPVGWKIGINMPAFQQRLGITAPVVGTLLDTTRFAPGARVPLDPGGRFALEAEVAAVLAEDVRGEAGPDEAAGAIGALLPAIELVNRAQPSETLEAILAHSVFHAGACFGERFSGGTELPAELDARVTLDGSEAAALDPAQLPDPPSLLALVARTLAARGERLRAGDHVLLGSLITPVAIQPGQTVGVEIPPLGALSLKLSG